MTEERDFDRLARAWLELGPDLAPERSVAAVLQAVEITPQVRRWFRRPSGRNHPMSRLLPVAAVVAVAVVAVGGLFMVSRPNQGGVGAPTSSPSAAASGAGADIPADLQYRWIGESRDVGRGLRTRTGLNLSRDSYDLTATDYLAGILGSKASLTAPGEITLVTAIDTDPSCSKGDTGVYRYVLSTGGTKLSVTKRSEDCAARAVAVPGDWYRVACKNTDDGCWGLLEPGTYPSQYIDPRLGASASWEPVLGAVTYTVPEGWANSEDWPKQFALTPAVDYALETKDGPPNGTLHGIFMLWRPVPAAQTADCSSAAEPGGHGTVDSLIEWVTTRPEVQVGQSGTVSVGPYTGRWVDLSVDPSRDFHCPDPADHSSIPLIKVTGGDDNSWWLLKGERLRAIFLDIGQGDVVAIGIGSTYPDRFEQLVAESMPIIQSFTFK